MRFFVSFLDDFFNKIKDTMNVAVLSILTPYERERSEGLPFNHNPELESGGQKFYMIAAPYSWFCLVFFFALLMNLIGSVSNGGEEG